MGTHKVNSRGSEWGWDPLRRCQHDLAVAESRIYPPPWVSEPRSRPGDALDSTLYAT